MSGEMNLVSLLKGMRPVLEPERKVFATVEGDDPVPYLALKPLGFFREREGLTLILNPDAAREARLTHSAPMRQITLTIYSSLEAVGLTAAISAALTVAGISANVVAAYYHDHVFVTEADADRALAVLEALAEGG